jgi:hypothetical protein
MILVASKTRRQQRDIPQSIQPISLNINEPRPSQAEMSHDAQSRRFAPVDVIQGHCEQGTALRPPNVRVTCTRKHGRYPGGDCRRRLSDAFSQGSVCNGMFLGRSSSRFRNGLVIHECNSQIAFEQFRDVRLLRSGSSRLVIRSQVETIDRQTLSDFLPLPTRDVELTFEANCPLKGFEAACFHRCTAKSICVPGPIECLAKSCFERAECRLSFEKESKLRRIEERCFALCSLKSFYIPQFVDFIDSTAFGGSNIKSITVGEANCCFQIDQTLSLMSLIPSRFDVLVDPVIS